MSDRGAIRVAGIVLLLSLFLLGGCAPSLMEARLAPAADSPGGAAGPLAATLEKTGSGHGTFAFAYPDGRACRGTYQTLRTGEAGVVLSLWHATTVSEALGVPGLDRAYGVARAVCSDETVIECVYLTDVHTGHGRGRCRDSRDGRYTIEL